MSTDASTIPLRERALAPVRARRLVRVRSQERSAARASPWPGRIALVTIACACALIVVMAADRPSILVATSHSNFFPRWMAGPLGGLVPGLTRDTTELKYLFSGALVVAYLAYMLVLAHAPRLSARWVIGAIAAVHVVFLLSPPLALTDIFNYINYARMEVLHNLNPYTTIPVSGPHTDPSYSLSNWHELLSPYGPLFTLLTFAVVPLGIAGAFWTLKVVLVCTSLATLHLIWKTARLLARDPVAAVALVGLNPIVLIWGLGADHNDFLMMFLIVLAFYLLVRTRVRTSAEQSAARAHDPAAALLAESAARARAAQPIARRWRALVLPLSGPEIGAGAALIGAAAIKASGAVIIPVVLAALLRRRRTLVQVLLGMAAALAVVGAASLIAFGLHVPDLSTQGSLVTNLSIPNIVGLAVGAGGETSALHTVFAAGLILAIVLCSVQAYRSRSAIAAAGWASVALLISLGWALPWYVLWILPLAALSRSGRLRVAALVLGAYLIIAWAPASGQLWNAIGFHPEKTTLGSQHQRVVRDLLY
jgi:alpha-1,6-mannosyltransferase